MSTITFTIPDAKLTRVTNAIKGLHPIPTDEDGVALFTPNQWAKEYHRRLIVREVLAWEKQSAAGGVSPDDSIVS